MNYYLSLLLHFQSFTVMVTRRVARYFINTNINKLHALNQVKFSSIFTKGYRLKISKAKALNGLMMGSGVCIACACGDLQF